VDRGYITASKRAELNARAENALKEMAGLIDYLQSEKAEENARRIKARATQRRAKRLQKRKEAKKNESPNATSNVKRVPQNNESELPNDELRTRERTN
jgi:hypothetical protein